MAKTRKTTNRKKTTTRKTTNRRTNTGKDVAEKDIKPVVASAEAPAVNTRENKTEDAGTKETTMTAPKVTASKPAPKRKAPLKAELEKQVKEMTAKLEKVTKELSTARAGQKEYHENTSKRMTTLNNTISSLNGDLERSRRENASLSARVDELSKYQRAANKLFSELRLNFMRNGEFVKIRWWNFGTWNKLYSIVQSVFEEFNKPVAGELGPATNGSGKESK
jgi:chromosome segregation ATPase